MRLEPNQFWTYWEWAFDQQGFLYGGILALILAVLGFLVGYIVSTLVFAAAWLVVVVRLRDEVHAGEVSLQS